MYLAKMKHDANKKKNEFFSLLSSFEKENAKRFPYIDSNKLGDRFLHEYVIRYLSKFFVNGQNIEYFLKNRPSTARLLSFNPYYINSTNFKENRFFAHWWFKYNFEKILRDYING